MPKKTVRIGVRLSADEQQQVERSAKGQGYVNPSAFVRAAIRNEINGRDGEVTEPEQRVTASLERLSQEIFRLHRGQQALFAVMDTLVKSFLTCVAEPPRDAISQSVARARERFSRFAKHTNRADSRFLNEAVIFPGYP